MDNDYGKYFDEKLIEKILGEINNAIAIPLLKPGEKYNQELWDYFNENLKNYMFNVALYILREHDVLDLAFDITKRHVSSQEVFDDLKDQFDFICERVHELKTNIKTFVDCERVQIINFIYCDIYCVNYKKNILDSEDLCVWFEHTKKQVESMFAKEIFERKKIKG